MLVQLTAYYIALGVLGLCVMVPVRVFLKRRNFFNGSIRNFILLIIVAGIGFGGYWAKTDLVIVEDGNCTDYALVGSATFTFDNGESVSLTTPDTEGELVLNNSQDSIVIDRWELCGDVRLERKSFLSKTLILVEPMSVFHFQGGNIHFAFREEPGWDFSEDMDVTRFQVRKYDPDDLEFLYLYSGPTDEGCPHGEGVLYKDNGYYYEGSFEYGIREGEGVETYYAGRYEGGFKDNHQDGQGKFYYRNGNIYEGAFEDGYFEGFGTFYTLETDETRIGYWCEDKFFGESEEDYNAAHH